MSFEYVDQAISALAVAEDPHVPRSRKEELIRTLFGNIFSEETESLSDAEQDVLHDVRMMAVRWITKKNPDMRVACNILRIYSKGSTAGSQRSPEISSGVRFSATEKRRVRRICRKVFHAEVDKRTKRPVRGTKCMVVLVGSLASGRSDYKTVDGKLKKSDKGAYEGFAGLIGRLIPFASKKHFSDVDMIIVNEVVFDSCDPAFKHTPWSFRLGDKYDIGVAGSSVLSALHRQLLHQRFGGLRGRWINFMIFRDKEGFARYRMNRDKRISVEPGEVTILDEIIR